MNAKKSKSTGEEDKKSSGAAPKNAASGKTTSKPSAGKTVVKVAGKPSAKAGAAAKNVPPTTADGKAPAPLKAAKKVTKTASSKKTTKAAGAAKKPEAAKTVEASKATAKVAPPAKTVTPKPAPVARPPAKAVPPVKPQAAKPAPKIAPPSAKTATPQKPAQAAPPPPPPPAVVIPKRIVPINEFETVKGLAVKFGVSPADIIKKAMGVGQIVTINQKMDKTLAEIVAAEYNCEIKFAAIGEEPEVEEKITGDTPRAPIVTVMGHVDHGKTTLLDAIKHTDVAGGEHGGITQHIGAYRVKTPKGDVAFLDTPGHEAFTSLRARGSKITDIVILVVSAADGVMPQTVEAINHARAAGVPIIVAINKMDIAGANADKIKSELNQHNLAPEEWGGDTLMVEISARNKINIDKLLDAVHLQAEMMELKCDPKAAAVGAVIESKLDPKKGLYVTLMVRNGTLRAGDVFVAGSVSGKVRAMSDESGAKIDAAGPSTPVLVLGASELPSPGERFYALKSEREARETVERLKLSMKEAARKISGRAMWGLSDLDKKDDKILRLILKADVSGSLEAVRDHIERIEHKEFTIQMVHSGVGPVSESDVNLARTTGAAIICFNVKADAANQTLADRNGVDIRTYRIVYELFDDIKKALEGLLSPKIEETTAGRAQVRKKFEITKVGAVAGCYVSEGKVLRGAKARILRDGVIVYDGKIASLRRVKDDVSSVEKGFECGITLENFKDIKENDIIEMYTVEKVKRLL
ncbi:MAG: translation initiation factor IF-2 [Endomicrobiia bacterium]|nr:translation initiation factor IF-2 [Endomicrobiia bacterium]